jgi:hypothetical protein
MMWLSGFCFGFGVGIWSAVVLAYIVRYPLNDANRDRTR